MTENEKSEYCWRKGIYIEQLKEWEIACKNANAEQPNMQQSLREELCKEKQNKAALEKELRRKEKALAETAALLVLRKKAEAIWGGSRGRMISDSDRHRAVELIGEARESGVRLKSACDELHISERTHQRWTSDGKVKYDGRPTAERSKPVNSLSDEEKQHILDIVNLPKYASQPPSQIVPDLTDNGIYIASTSTFYRVLREYKLQTHRSRSKTPLTKKQTHMK